VLIRLIQRFKRGIVPFALAVAAALPMAMPLAAQDSPPPVSSPPPAKKDEPHDFLLLGLQLSPAAGGLSNMWVVSEGGDFVLAGPLLGGYEIGMFHRITEEALEYRFKTFFNLKWNLLADKRLGGYFGLGGGMLEILRTRTLESGFQFAVGMQGIMGLRIGPPGKDKLIVELQVLGLNKDDGGIQIHLMTGARF
jgi:hypothetical protein